VWAESYALLDEYNAGKKSVGLDLKMPDGLAVAKRILSKCDIFVTNLTVRAIASLGLGYESVRAARSDIIYLQMTGFGATAGPYTNFLAWERTSLDSPASTISPVGRIGVQRA